MGLEDYFQEPVLKFGYVSSSIQGHPDSDLDIRPGFWGFSQAN